MQMKLFSRQRQNEQGQTIILVAISLVSLLAMAALAIDIVTLYLASSEIQRAADATALAAAKAIADSGVTTSAGDRPQPAGCPNFGSEHGYGSRHWAHECLGGQLGGRSGTDVEYHNANTHRLDSPRQSARHH